MKRIFLVTSCILISLVGLAAVRPKPVILVKDFETNLKNWIETGEPVYHNRIKDMCEVSTRCSDELAMEKATYPGKDQDLDSYLKIFSDISNYNPSIRFSETKDITLNNCRTQEDKTLRSVYTKIHVSCSKWGKAINEEAVFYINESDKIVYIGDYLSESCKDCACAPPFEVLDMQFLFEDKDGTTSEWGETKGDDGLCRWVYARVKIKSKRNFDNFKLYRLIYFPDGTKMRCASCDAPSQYSTSSIINISEGDNWYSLGRFGYSDGTYTMMGTYKYEVWYGNQVLIRREFEIGKPYASKISVSDEEVNFDWKSGEKKLIAIYTDGDEWSCDWHKGSEDWSNKPYISKKDYGVVLESQYNEPYWNIKKDSAILRIKSGKVYKDIVIRGKRAPKIIPSDDGKIGGGYTYSSLYPLNTTFPLALHFDFIALDPHFSWGTSTTWMRFISYSVEGAVNFDNKQYTLTSGTYTSYDPKGYLLFSPGLYLNYITLQCGVGMMFGNHDNMSSLSTSLMLQPAVVGYIPIYLDYSNFFLTIKAGYNCVPSMPEMNGICFGLGIQYAELWY